MFPVDGSKLAVTELVEDGGSPAVGFTPPDDEPPPQATRRRMGAARSAPRNLAGIGHLVETDQNGAKKIARRIPESSEKERPPAAPGA
jgi:hypothetical protein